ncbi:MAG: GMP synthase subunit A [Candidatus Hydrothermarchaeales archaeon]
MIAVIANRGQYNHRIYRTLKYLGAEAQLIKNDIHPEDLKALDLEGIVIGGGPHLEESGNSKRIIEEFRRELPILGICLGHQLLAEVFGGEVSQAEVGEYAEAEIIVDDEDHILKGLSPKFSAWVSHRDEVRSLPKGFEKLAHSETCEIEAMRHSDLPLFGVQFHPEVEHTPKGPEIFRNFLELCM